ncbi:MAG: hypothetical protein HFG55_08705 [Lachnospiraceae bacterium]|nr:hypothetical protein [Lachnospiraceae bacterium]
MGRGGKCSANFDFAGILDPETGKISRAFPASSHSFFQGVPSEKINLMKLALFIILFFVYLLYNILCQRESKKEQDSTTAAPDLKTGVELALLQAK